MNTVSDVRTYVEEPPIGRENVCTEDFCTEAARMGDLKLLQLLIEELEDQEYPCDERTALAAVESGVPAVLEYLLNDGCSMDKECCTVRALELLSADPTNGEHKRNIGCDVEPCLLAAQWGDLELMKALCQEGLNYAKEKEVCQAAAERGDYEMLQFLREDGCRWDERTCKAAFEYALRTRDWKAHNYVEAKGCPRSDEFLEHCYD
jgi:hypothetical protein